MAADEKAELDTVTLGYLEDVKRGKPRKFAMICKGVKILSLVVYKKGSLEKYKKEAKEGGRGQFYHGVVEGKGQNINFKLSREDKFDKPPTKTQTLKQFLKDTTPFNFKPLFEIVDSLGPVLDDENPLDQRFLSLQEAALAACEQHPKQATAINQACLAIGQLLDQDDPGAESKIVALEALLKKLGAAPASPTPDEAEPASPAAAASVPPPPPPPPPASEPTASSESPSATPPPPPPPPPASGASQATSAPAASPEDARNELKVRLTKLLKEATPLMRELGNEVKELATRAKTEIQGDEHESADATLEEIQELLRKYSSSDESVDEGEDSETVVRDPKELLEEMKALLSRMDDLMDETRGGAEYLVKDLRGQLKKVGSLIQKKELAEASRMLDDVENKLDNFEYRDELFETWQELKKDVVKDVREFVVQNSGQRYVVADLIGKGAAAEKKGDLMTAVKAFTELWERMQGEYEDGELDDQEELDRFITVPNIAFTKARLAWDQTRKKIQGELKSLEKAILDVCKEEPDFQQIADGTKRLHEIMETLDESLLDQLDEALNASEDKERQEHYRAAREIIDDYVDFVEEDDLLQDIDDNGFVSTKIRSELLKRLKEVNQMLQA